MVGDQLNSGAASLMGAVDAAPEDGSSTGKRPAVLSTIISRAPTLDSNPSESVGVDREALRIALLELHDVRARQGADWRWMDSLHPSLRVELDAAMQDAAPSLDEAAIRHQERQKCALELLILVEDSDFWYRLTRAGVLRAAADLIARGQVA